MVNIDQQPAAILERNWFSDFLSGTYYYAEGIKLRITPNASRNKGEEASWHYNSNRVELCEAAEYINQNPKTIFNLVVKSNSQVICHKPT